MTTINTPASLPADTPFPDNWNSMTPAEKCKYFDTEPCGCYERMPAVCPDHSQHAKDVVHPLAVSSSPGSFTQALAEGVVKTICINAGQYDIGLSCHHEGVKCEWYATCNLTYISHEGSYIKCKDALGVEYTYGDNAIIAYNGRVEPT